MVRNSSDEGVRLDKAVYTTGEVAEICNVSQQTVIRCFDAGKLKGFRVPGSRFRRIPRESLVQFMKDHNIPIDQVGSGKRRVLVVDDDAAIVDMLVDCLERTNRFEVETASSGFDAGLKTKDFRPDVMVLDYLLGDINGDAVIRSVRNDATLQSMKIIIVSGIVNREGVESLLQTGANDFLQKPFKMDELVQRIDEVLRV